MTYKIVRQFFKGSKEVIETGLTLEEAKAHCSDSETSSRTATSEWATKLTAEKGEWFDSFYKEE